MFTTENFALIGLQRTSRRALSFLPTAQISAAALHCLQKSAAPPSDPAPLLMSAVVSCARPAHQPRFIESQAEDDCHSTSRPRRHPILSVPSQEILVGFHQLLPSKHRHPKGPRLNLTSHMREFIFFVFTVYLLVLICLL